MKRTCIECKNTYETRHATKEEAFATRDMESREQWVSGICSSTCWNKLFPPEEPEGEEPS